VAPWCWSRCFVDREVELVEYAIGVSVEMNFLWCPKHGMFWSEGRFDRCHCGYQTNIPKSKNHNSQSGNSKMSENGNGFRSYDSGALRDTGIGKLEFSRCEHPAVTKRFAEFMLSKSIMPDGSYRRGDNWQKGIPTDDLIESLERHNSDIQLHLKKWGEMATEDLQNACCAAIFNIQAILLKELEIDREKNKGIPQRSEDEGEETIYRDRPVRYGGEPPDGGTSDHDQHVVPGRELGPAFTRGSDGSGLAGPEDVRDRTVGRFGSTGETQFLKDQVLVSEPESKA